MHLQQTRPRNGHKNVGRDILLPCNGIHDVIQFCSASVAVGIKNRVFDGTEVKQPLPAATKVLAGTYGFRFSLDGVVAETRFLCWNPQHVKNTAGNVFADTAVGIGQLCRLPVPGGRELQHIYLTVI